MCPSYRCIFSFFTTGNPSSPNPPKQTCQKEERKLNPRKLSRKIPPWKTTTDIKRPPKKIGPFNPKKVSNPHGLPTRHPFFRWQTRWILTLIESLSLWSLPGSQGTTSLALTVTGFPGFPHNPSNQVFFKHHFSKTNKVHSKSPPFFFWCCYIFLFPAPGFIKLPIKKPRDSLVRLVVEAKSIFSGKSGKMFWSVLRPSGWKNLENSTAFGSPKWVMELWMEDDVPAVNVLGNF